MENENFGGLYLDKILSDLYQIFTRDVTTNEEYENAKKIFLKNWTLALLKIYDSIMAAGVCIRFQLNAFITMEPSEFQNSNSTLGEQ